MSSLESRRSLREMGGTRRMMMAGRHAGRFLPKWRTTLSMGRLWWLPSTWRRWGICDMCLTEANFYFVSGDRGRGELLLRGRFKPESEGGGGGGIWCWRRGWGRGWWKPGYSLSGNSLENQKFLGKLDYPSFSGELWEVVEGQDRGWRERVDSQVHGRDGDGLSERKWVELLPRQFHSYANWLVDRLIATLEYWLIWMFWTYGQTDKDDNKGQDRHSDQEN